MNGAISPGLIAISDETITAAVMSVHLTPTLLPPIMYFKFWSFLPFFTNKFNKVCFKKNIFVFRKKYVKVGPVKSLFFILIIESKTQAI